MSPRPERWLVITARVPSEELRDAVAEGLVALGGSAVEERNGELITYLPAEEHDAGAFGEALNRFVGAAVEVEARVEADSDWSERWKAGLAPRRIGNSIVVAPTWTEPELQPGDVLVSIDPEMAFGTGEHATTRSALRLLERVVKPGAEVLDVGTGSAVLAIAAAGLGAGHVLAVENDPDAVLNARDNIVRNHADEVVEIDLATVDEAYCANFGARFDVIVANVLSGIIRPLLPVFRSVLKPDGRVVIGGILVSEGETMQSAAQANGFTVEAVEVEEEWWTALLAPVAREAGSSPGTARSR